MHYPIAGGDRINFAVTLSAQLAAGHWQAKFLERTRYLTRWQAARLPGQQHLCHQLAALYVGGAAASIGR